MFAIGWILQLPLSPPPPNQLPSGIAAVPCNGNLTQQFGEQRNACGINFLCKNKQGFGAGPDLNSHSEGIFPHFHYIYRAFAM